MNIPLVRPDLPEFGEVEPLFRQALSSGRLTNFGPLAQQFERSIELHFGEGCQAVSTSSGTVALMLALQALGVGAGDEVLIPSYTFTATAQALLYVGARPVFGEVGDDWTLDPQDAEAMLHRHPGVSAVIGVHVHGNVCKVAELESVVQAASQRSGRPIRLLFDAAHALGARRAGRAVGTFGDAEAFSLSITKALVCGEGGLVTTCQPAIASDIKVRRNYGVASAYNATEMGLNGKFAELHAAIGCANLPKLEAVLARREVLAQVYRQQLSDAIPDLGWQSVDSDVQPTWKDFNVLLPRGVAHRRAELAAWLVEHGIETRAYFSPAVHQQTFFRQFADRPLPRTEEVASRVMTLPFYTTMSDEEVAYVRATFAEGVRSILA